MDKMIQVFVPKPTDDLALKPCPFCGSDVVAYVQREHAAGPRWAVVCFGCSAEVYTGTAQQRCQAQAKWNRREESVK